MGEFTGSSIFREAKCPICGKIFLVPVQNIYKVDGKNLCSYTCFRIAQKKKSNKKSKSKFKRRDIL